MTTSITVESKDIDHLQDLRLEESNAVRRLQQGDISGLEVLVRLHQQKALSIAYLVVRDAQDQDPRSNEIKQPGNSMAEAQPATAADEVIGPFTFDITIPLEEAPK